MALPEPRRGLVIAYSFLWLREAAGGQEEGRKDCPCVIVLAVENVEGEKLVTVAPVTHGQPDAGDGVEMPAATKFRLGLDDWRSWILSTEVNTFAWPGSDLRPVARNKPRQFAYGFVPDDLVNKVVDQMKSRRSLRVTRRT